MAPTPPTVLLIDDEARLLVGLAAAMRRAGFEVHCASTGSAGLELARSVRPDVVVCDVMMPPPDGFELRRLLDEDPETATIPFLFLSARSAPEDRRRGIEGGADDYVTKPFDRHELIARVRALLRRQRVARAEGRSEASAELERLQSTILSAVGAELRRPVAGLLSTLQTALARHLDGDREKLAAFLEAATDDVSRLESTVLDLLTLVELERLPRPVAREQVELEHDLRRPVASCLEHWRRAELKHLELRLRVAPEAVVLAPRQLFRRALFHLVDNACKFSPEGGTVSVELLANGYGGFVLTVTDSGAGIAAEAREHVFEPFFRGGGEASAGCGGLGLGLTIVRAFAEALGGEVTIEESAGACCVALAVPLWMAPRTTLADAGVRTIAVG